MLGRSAANATRKAILPPRVPTTRAFKLEWIAETDSRRAARALRPRRREVDPQRQRPLVRDPARVGGGGREPLAMEQQRCVLRRRDRSRADRGGRADHQESLGHFGKAVVGPLVVDCEAQCADMGGIWHPEWGYCGPPNPCDIYTPAEPSSWGAIKAIYR